MDHPGPLLAATDFSAQARHAADRAARLARESGAPLTLMHVLQGDLLQDMRAWLGAGHVLDQQLHDESRRQLQQLADDLRAARRVGATTRLADGAVPDEIVREADAMGASLLVLGARGTGFLRRLVLGSTAEQLLRRTTRPLLVVRERPHEPYRRVLLALDFSPWSAGVVALARRVAPHAHCVLLNAFAVPFEGKLKFAGVHASTIDHYRLQAHAAATRQLHALAHDAGLRPGHWTPCIVDGDASRHIVEQEQAQDCDLVVLGKHGRSVTEDLLLGSVTQHVLAEGRGDVLVSTAQAG